MGWYDITNTFTGYYESRAYPDRIEPEKIITNSKATIVFWSDNTKTVVKRYNEEYDKEKAVAIAYAKKMFGSYRKFKKLFKIEEE